MDCGPAETLAKINLLPFRVACVRESHCNNKKTTNILFNSIHTFLKKQKKMIYKGKIQDKATAGREYEGSYVLYFDQRAGYTEAKF